MNITIYAVGKIKERFYADAVSEYAKRLSRYCRFRIVEVADEKAPEQLTAHERELILRKEGARILAKTDPKMYLIALAIEGQAMDSCAFSQLLEGLSGQGHPDIGFVIGGSLGLSAEVLDRADLCISFSAMTFPHQLMRVILSEQIYRGFRIARKEPYHK